MDTIELGRCCGLWVSFALILNQPRVELPTAAKRRLGLDEERSWVVTSETNVFLWPGPDLRFLPGRGPESAAYGVLPPDVFRVVRDRFLAGLRARRAATVPRTE